MQKKAQVVHGKKRISREVIGTSGCLGIICLTWTSISAEIIIFYLGRLAPAKNGSKCMY